MGKVGKNPSVSKECPERFLGVNGQNPSVFKSSRLHVVMLQFFFIESRYTLDSSKPIDDFPELLNQVGIS